MQGLMNGAECSTSNTPLASLLKQQNTDHSLHSSGFNPTTSSGLPGASLRSRQQVPGGAENHAEAAKFFNGGGRPQSAFEMDSLRRELEMSGRARGGGTPDQAWAMQYSTNGGSPAMGSQEFAGDHFRQNGRADLTAEFWQQRSHAASPVSAMASQASSQQQQGNHHRAFGAYNPYNRFSSGGGMGLGQVPMFQSQTPQASSVADSKGKGRFVELNDEDWEAQFAKAGEAAAKETIGSEQLASEPAQPQARNLPTESDIKNIAEQLENDGSDADAELLATLEETWQNLQTSMNNSSITDAEMAAWEAQYGSQFANLDAESGLDEGMRYRSQEPVWDKDNVDSFLQDTTPYPYIKENPYLERADPYADGQRMLAEGAPLNQAALAFEAACQQDPTRAEAWRAAGETWAADEREQRGVRALQKGVACGGPDSIAAWLSLAIAYVNEGQELRALATLERWVALAYPEVVSKLPQQPRDPNNPWDQHERTTEQFLAAARAGPSAREQGQSSDLSMVDADVQVGLGVLFYSNADYAKAKDCFEAALSVRPNDFLLWNRLGATLANGGSPEDAIFAYRKALDLRPTFTRAIYNLAVSALNIGCYQEAAEHLLAALDGQKHEEGKGKAKERVPTPMGSFNDTMDDDESNNLWNTLRRAFLCMDRHDLAEMASLPNRADVSAFRGQGFDF